MSAADEDIANSGVFGFYLSPPVWVGDFVPPTVRPDQLNKGNLATIREEVARYLIAEKIPLSVRREGLFLFYLTEWLQTEVASRGDETRYDTIADRIMEASRFLNTYLSFLYTYDAEVDRHGRQTMVATPESMIRSNSVDAETGLSGNPTLNHLEMSSYAVTYGDFPVTADGRIFFRNLGMTIDAIREAAVRTSELLAEHDDMAIQLCDLHLRATRAYQDHNYNLSLIINWSISERLLGELWAQYLSDNRVREETSFINNERLKSLQDTRSFTASVRAEVLSILGRLPLDVLKPLTATRKKRNEWLHELEITITRQDAATAAETAEAMLKLVRSIHLVGNRSLQIRY